MESAFVESCRRGVTDASRQHALKDLERATSIDPINVWAFALRAWSHSAVADDEEAVRLARHAIDLDSAAFTGRWALVWTLAAAGRRRGSVGHHGTIATIRWISFDKHSHEPTVADFA